MFSLPRTTLLSLLLCSAGCVAASEADHREFDASLAAPYHGEPAPGEPRSFQLSFDYPLVAAPQSVSWTLELMAPGGGVVRQWRGEQSLFRAPVNVSVRWDGRIGAAAAPAGIYRVRLQATSRPAGADALDAERVEQSWEIAVGRAAAPSMPAFRPVPRRELAMAPAPGELPFNVYLGNLHSQTSHSDGGGDLANCTGAQDPQSSALGPGEAFAYARDHGLDVLVASEHNHCANWGMSYTNRTGVLLPTGTLLSRSAFLDALKARRVFATMDKGSQLVLTANGRMMGERFANTGPVSLVAHFASAAGKAVSSVLMFEGVPGRNGTVAELSRTPVTTFTPDPGEHFYYARVTQEDGNMLWSAPVWVTQQ